jgi:hypothetical protein
MRRKNVVVAFFDTIQNDVVREIDRSVQTEAFQKRLAVDQGRDFAGSCLSAPLSCLSQKGTYRRA